jgi:hypothetical protein
VTRWILAGLIGFGFGLAAGLAVGAHALDALTGTDRDEGEWPP